MFSFISINIYFQKLKIHQLLCVYDICILLYTYVRMCIYIYSYSFCSCSCVTVDLNSGVLLWLQQYRAMFTKHALNGIRHIAALIIQLALPTVFVLLALIFAKTTPNRLTPDPARTLIITNSIPLQSNTKLFTADMRTNLPDFFKVCC